MRALKQSVMKIDPSRLLLGEGNHDHPLLACTLRRAAYRHDRHVDYQAPPSRIAVESTGVRAAAAGSNQLVLGAPEERLQALAVLYSEHTKTLPTAPTSAAGIPALDLCLSITCRCLLLVRAIQCTSLFRCSLAQHHFAFAIRLCLTNRISSLFKGWLEK